MSFRDGAPECCGCRRHEIHAAIARSVVVVQRREVHSRHADDGGEHHKGNLVHLPSVEFYSEMIENTLKQYLDCVLNEWAQKWACAMHTVFKRKMDLFGLSTFRELFGI
jgi:hypothetical protein